jgi:hypothetical protein
VLLPLCASVYFPLAVAANLPGELLRFGDIIVPVIATLAVGTLSWGLAYANSRIPSKAALVSTLWMLGFSSLGAVAEVVEVPFGNAATVARLLVLALYAILLVCLSVATLRARRRFEGSARFVTVVAVRLVAWTIATVAWHWSRVGRLPWPVAAANVRVTTRPVRPSPDIYVLVLDKYTSSAVLRSHFHFDNQPFELALRRRGFVVPSAPRTNYVHTFLTLAAMLNFRYLDDLPGRFGPDAPWERAYPLIENNRLYSFLRTLGYQIVSFPTEFQGTRQSRYADLQLPAPADVRPEIYVGWIQLTAWPVLKAINCHFSGCDPDRPPYQPAQPSLMDWRFQTLAHSAGVGRSPRLVFAHLLVPHEPYIYGPDCSHRTPYWPLSDRANEVRVRDAYLDQIRCVNRKVLEVVDSIQAHSRVPSVILIQGDHGHGRLGRTVPPLEEVNAYEVGERISCFAAYSLPNVPRDEVSDSISPINVIRLVLRHYFGADLSALPDVTFWSSSVAAYGFQRLP